MVTVVTEALAVVIVATEALAAVTVEEGSEVEGGGISGETVAVVTASGTAVVAIATTEEDRNAASAKRLIIKVPTCGLIRLTVTHLGWQ